MPGVRPGLRSRIVGRALFEFETIRKAPKALLHDHLDGGLRPETVLELAEYLELPEAVLRLQPTTDTYSLAQSQEEFYFSLPLEKLDLCLYAHNHGLPAESVAGAVGLSVEDVGRIFRDIEQKRRATRYLHLPALLVEPVTEVPVSEQLSADS